MFDLDKEVKELVKEYGLKNGCNLGHFVLDAKDSLGAVHRVLIEMHMILKNAHYASGRGEDEWKKYKNTWIVVNKLILENLEACDRSIDDLDKRFNSVLSLVSEHQESRYHFDRIFTLCKKNTIRLISSISGHNILVLLMHEVMALNAKQAKPKLEKITKFVFSLIELITNKSSE